MQNEKPENVLIDPSLLVDEQTLERITGYMRQQRLDSQKEKFFVPLKFVQILSEAERNLKDILFFANAAKMVDLKKLRTELQTEQISNFAVLESYKEENSYFYTSLLEETKSEIVSEILFEEWVFLQQKSWIISRIKKSFTYFVKAGSVSIEMGKRTFNLGVKKTLKKDPKNILTNADRLRSLAKWIAVGGSSASALYDPIAGAIGGVAAGFFLLIDPNIKKSPPFKGLIPEPFNNVLRNDFR